MFQSMSRGENMILQISANCDPRTADEGYAASGHPDEVEVFDVVITFVPSVAPFRRRTFSEYCFPTGSRKCGQSHYISRCCPIEQHC